MGRDFVMVDDEETSLHRKYGYAIMALSVVVLAVLMVWSVAQQETFNTFSIFTNKFNTVKLGSNEQIFKSNWLV